MIEEEKRLFEKCCVILLEWAAKSQNAYLENVSVKWIGTQSEEE